jgi:predicted outer membrane repeat protein
MKGLCQLRRPAAVVIATLAIGPVALGDTVDVCPEGCDYAVIQDAIDQAEDGDEVVVSSGTYTGSGAAVVDLGGKSITLRGADGAEATIIDGEGARCGILCESGESGKTLIEGFTIRNGSNDKGGGIVCEGSSPVIRFCVFQDNIASQWGGGAYCIDGGNPTFQSCTFERNSANNGGGMAVKNSTPELLECLFDQNSAVSSGGGLRLYPGSPVIMSVCEFTGNSADIGGGVRVMNNDDRFAFDQCRFTGNLARVGAGMAAAHSQGEVTSGTFENNVADLEGGGIHCTGGEVDVLDSLFCANFPEHLKSCNSGLGNEFYDECPPDNACPADLNSDGTVGVNDLLIMMSDWHCEKTDDCENPGSDLNQDGSVNILDLLDLISVWGSCG